MKKFSSLFLVSLLSGATTLGAYKLFIDDNGLMSDKKSIVTTAPANSYARPVGLSGELLDFTEAADKAVHYVVHVKNVSYRTINNERMAGIFQFEGYALKVLTRQMGVKEFNDIVAITSLARPGPGGGLPDGGQVRTLSPPSRYPVPASAIPARHEA